MVEGDESPSRAVLTKRPGKARRFPNDSPAVEWPGDLGLITTRADFGKRAWRACQLAKARGHVEPCAGGEEDGRRSVSHTDGLVEGEGRALERQLEADLAFQREPREELPSDARNPSCSPPSDRSMTGFRSIRRGGGEASDVESEARRKRERERGSIDPRTSFEARGLEAELRSTGAGWKYREVRKPPRHAQGRRDTTCWP